ncbi:MAG: hypothetical protein J1F67_05120 [Muribaculaceae bacterium]|nr:hypothetical protein [Muribaculaceae bacterium]
MKKKTEKRNDSVMILGQEYKVKKTVRSLFIFEKMADKPFEVKTMLDNYMFLYSVLLACNPDNVLKWEDFLDAIDEDASIIDRMNELLSDRNELDLLLNESKGEEGEVKKK